MTSVQHDPYFGAVLLIVAFPAALIGLELIAALCRVALWAIDAFEFFVRRCT